jgi:hypothetical protein
MSLNLYNFNTITKKQEISNKVNQEYLHIISQYVEKLSYYEVCGKYEKIQKFIKAYISDIENFKINYNLLYPTNNEPCYLQMISDCLYIPMYNV